VIGTSVQGRDITAYRMGTPGGRVVLVIGVIHGDENKGAKVTELLRTLPTPVNTDLWIIDSINPDGQTNGTRQNANGVDLNRNFEEGWSYIAKGNHGQYSGEAAADQPETQAVQAFVTEIKPAIAIWYHQDANRITLGGARKEIPRRYAELVGLTTGDVPCSQRCTGTAGKFVNTRSPGATSFLVELPGSSKVTAAMVKQHANAVLSVITL
jgi:murein peptide amidase A